MSTLLKDMYSPALYEGFSTICQQILPGFEKGKFIDLIFDEEWEQRELKDRMKHSSSVLRRFLPEDFKSAMDYSLQIIKELKKKPLDEYGFAFMFFPDYIEKYGIDNFEDSVWAIERVTQFASCEFAVRPFILKYGSRMMDQMMAWSGHSHQMVRRLASEGCRPRLPWAMGLPEFKKDPSSVLPILENLKDDPSETVRRSVANNLNDISKDNPEIALSIFTQWKTEDKNRNRLVKHGCRTLLKQGHPEALKLFGFAGIEDLEVNNFTIKNPEVKIGEDLVFSFELKNKSSQKQKIRLEYGVYYKKANGSLARKVFQISEREFPPNSISRIERKRSFKLITTRKYYPGEHRLVIIVNGEETKTKRFEVEFE